MRNRNLPTLLTLVLTVWAVGCAEEPPTGVDAAKGRVAALATEAGTYAQDAYEAAEAVVAQLDAEMETQAAAFALFREYERANELVASVEASADDVESAIDAEKQRLRTGTNGVVADAEQAVSTAQDAIAVIPAEDLPEEQAATWETDLAGVDTALTETGRLLAGDQLFAARTEADSALAAATDLNASITAHVAEVARVREEAAARRARGEITIPSNVLADGQRLAAGDYLLSLADNAQALSDTGPGGRWVEFLDGDDVAGRGLAVVIPDGELADVSDNVLRNEARVVALKEGDYVRVWLNREGVNYLVHLPPANIR